MTLPEIPQLMLSFEMSRPKQGLFLLRVAHSEREFFQSRRDEGAYHVSLPRAIEQTALMDDGGWRARPRESFAARHLGAEMWRRLPPQLQAELLSGSPARPTRIAIVSQSAGIDDVPWEWLDAGGPQPIAVSDAVRFIRLAPCRYALPPLTASPPIRVLSVTTNPKDEQQLNPQRERAAVMESVARHASYELRDSMEPGVEAFKQALAWGPHIVHYVGHAGITAQGGAIILHDDRSGTRWLTAGELSQMLPTSVRLLCLSTCVTGPNYQIGGLSKIAHSSTDLALPTTIVNQYAIEEEAARIFWRGFYPGLVQHRGDVVEAFHGARQEVSVVKTDASWASFALVVRDGSGFPLRIAEQVSEERTAIEIQAQWSARLANALTAQVSTLEGDVHGTFAETIGSEERRIELLRDQIDKF